MKWKNKYEIVKCDQSHVDALKGRLRQSDLDEIRASSNMIPDWVLQMSFQVSREMCWAGMMHGKVITIFGACGHCLLSVIGVPWLLASPEFNCARLEVLKMTRHYVDVMKGRFQRLENHIDARQTKSIRWLKWAGFTLEPAKPWGRMGLPFHEFWWEK